MSALLSYAALFCSKHFFSYISGLSILQKNVKVHKNSLPKLNPEQYAVDVESIGEERTEDNVMLCIKRLQRSNNST